MKDLNSSLLIGFGFVLGAVSALIAAPFLLTVELVQGSPKWIGMPEGYGDLLGGIISGTMTLGAGYILWRIGERKRDQADDRAKAVLAHKLLRPSQKLFESVKCAIEGNPYGSGENEPPDTFNRSEYEEDYEQSMFAYFANNWIRNEPRVRESLKEFSKNTPDSSLGLEIIETYQNIVQTCSTLLSTGTPELFSEALKDRESFAYSLTEIRRIMLMRYTEQYVSELKQLVKRRL